jgi:hypothetical protein
MRLLDQKLIRTAALFFNELALLKDTLSLLCYFLRIPSGEL